MIYRNEVVYKSENPDNSAKWTKYHNLGDFLMGSYYVDRPIKKQKTMVGRETDGNMLDA